jgi:mono/diheme cytochrome c family protein
MKKVLVSLLVAALVAMFALPADAGSGRKTLRVKVKRMKKGKTPPGGSALLRVKVKNRTGEEQEVTVRLFRQDDDTEPFETRELRLDAKERVRLEVECPVPVDFRERKLRVRAEVESAEDDDGEAEDDDDTTLPVETPESDEVWLLGRDLYQANCLACHALDDHELVEEDFGDWIEVMREGEDEMPAFPTLGKPEVRAMRTYFFDADRNVTEPGPTDPPPATITYENTVKAILDVSCVACHRAGNALGGIAVDTYASAFANRAATVDSVVKDRMPTGTPLSAEKKKALSDWLDGGAPEK